MAKRRRTKKRQRNWKPVMPPEPGQPRPSRAPVGPADRPEESEQKIIGKFRDLIPKPRNPNRRS